MSENVRGSGNHIGTRIAGVAAILMSGAVSFSGGANAGSVWGPDQLDRAQVDEGYPAAILGGGWKAQRRYGYQGPAGVYDCAPGQVNSELARTACGGRKFPNRFF